MKLIYQILAVFNLFVTAWKCFSEWSSWPQPAAFNERYSYHGTDYPFELPLDISDTPVIMTLHETVHFSLNWSDPVAQWEWMELVAAPKENGRIRLGSDNRLFTMVFWHGFHCLSSIQTAFNDPNDDYAGFGHLHHCINYLRQMLLCQAAETLEVGDFVENDLENDRVGDTMICRDWRRVYAAMEENYQGWSEWAESWN